jgi:hypothetical protein
LDARSAADPPDMTTLIPDVRNQPLASVPPSTAAALKRIFDRQGAISVAAFQSSI